MLAQTSAATAPAQQDRPPNRSRVRRKSRSGASRLRAQAVRPDERTARLRRRALGRRLGRLSALGVDRKVRRGHRHRSLDPEARGGKRSRGSVAGSLFPNSDALLGSNTSTLPITSLAANVSRPANFIRPALLLSRGQDAAAGDHPRQGDQRRGALPRARCREADQEDADRRQRQPRLLHQPRDRDLHQRGHLNARGRDSGADDRAGLLAGRLPSAGVAAVRRAEHEAHAEDPQRLTRCDRGRRRDLDRPPCRGRHRPYGQSVRPAGSARGQGVLRVRRRQADRSVGRPCASSSRPSAIPRRSCSATSRSD